MSVANQLNLLPIELSDPALAERHSDGKFRKGVFRGGPGNPLASKVIALRNAMFKVLTPYELTQIVVKLIDLAKDGNVEAAKVLLDRGLGRVRNSDEADAAEAGAPFKIYINVEGPRVV